MTFDPEGSVVTLPELLPTIELREEAVDLVARVVGEVKAPSDGLKSMISDICKTLDLPPPSEKQPNGPGSPKRANPKLKMGDPKVKNA